MVISKSEFMMFLKHPAWLWLKKYDKGKIPIPDEELQLRFDEGALFESYAEKIFKNTVKLGYKHEDGSFSGSMYYSLPETTLAEINKGTKVIFQGRLEVDNLTSIFDVLERNSDGSFNLYEIKSSTKSKPEHIPDLAFQTIVLEKSGFKVKEISVLHVNNKYKRQGDIDPAGITSKTEVTDEVRDLIPWVEGQIEEAFKVLANKTMPDISPRYLTSGTMAEWLEIYELVKGPVPAYSIFKLCGLKSDTVAWLEDNGIEVLGDIPLDCPLNERQTRQVEAMRRDTQHIDKEEIKNFLDSLEYPLYFFDYETFSGVIPAFDGYRPYQQVPFQYSLHILPAPGAELIHKEYLHTENSKPESTLLKQLSQDIGGKGSVISWSMKFEKARNNELAEANPEYANILLNINDRMVDLMTPFSKGWFVDKDFFGSASIKAVLPVLVPELSYKDLEITYGGEAQRVWMETVLRGKNKDKKNEIMKDLIEYCKLDTYAMYAIFNYLRERLS